MEFTQADLDRDLANGGIPVTLLDLAPYCFIDQVLGNGSATTDMVIAAYENPLFFMHQFNVHSMLISHPNAPDDMFDRLMDNSDGYGDWEQTLSHIALDSRMPADRLIQIWDWTFDRFEALSGWGDACTILGSVLSNTVLEESRREELARNIFRKLDGFTRMLFPAHASPENPFPHRATVGYRQIMRGMGAMTLSHEFLVSENVVDALSARSASYEKSRLEHDYFSDFNIARNASPVVSDVIMRDSNLEAAKAFLRDSDPDFIKSVLHEVTDQMLMNFLERANLSGELAPVLTIPIATLSNPSGCLMPTMVEVLEPFAAHDERTPESSLQILAMHPEIDIRELVVNNPSSPLHVRVLASLVE